MSYTDERNEPALPGNRRWAARGQERVIEMKRGGKRRPVADDQAIKQL
jgi:hypothetical protein